MKVCIVGAGVMGAGIAQVFAAAGHETMLCDMTAELAKKGCTAIEKELARLVGKEKMTAGEAELLLQRLTAGTIELAAGCELVVEAVKEEQGVKDQLFQRLNELCSSKTVFASNTSSLSITALAAAAGRPVVGMHFFNPAPVMELVEVVAGPLTPPELVEQIRDLARDLGKKPVLVQEAPGFVVNRLLIPMINEAAELLMAGVASAEDIDRAMMLGAKHPMGPLVLGDLIGLDVVLSIMETLQGETGEDKYRPCQLLRQMVRARRLGRKTGQGFFTYEGAALK